MTARARLAAALLASVVVLRAESQQPPPRSGQTFRTGTDVVMVDVSVRDGGKPVTGLTANDFVLTDNGVRQQIDSVEATAVPIDLTLVVDVSGNPNAAWTAPLTPAAVGEVVRKEVTPIASLLRPTDRLRVLASDTYVQHVVPMTNVAALPPLRIDGGGLSSLYDTLTAALLQPVEPARRHVVIARSKGLDSLSSMEATAVREVAERSDALFHLVVMETAFDNEAALRAFQCANMGFCWPNRTLWVPHRRRLVGPRPYHTLLREGQVLAAGAEATGGALHQAQMLTEPTLGGTFKKAFEDFRSSYVLRYTLTGVPAGGWHNIEVTTPRSRGYRVKARKGYLVETPAPKPVVSPLPERLRSVADFTAAYERGAYRQVVEDLRRLSDPDDLLRDFEEAGNPWPGHPRREATMVLDLVEPALHSRRKETREAAFKTIDRFRRLIQHPLEPDLFERYWYFGLLAMFEGMLNPNIADIYIDAALGRFPDEPRFVLSRAIVTDQRWSTRGAAPTTSADRPSSAHTARVRSLYEAAIAFPEAAVEARIRLAYFLHRIGEHKDAMTHLTAAGTTTIPEPSLRYVYLLVLGHVLWSLDRQAEAQDAYRAAQTIFPNAQSPRVALMNTLLLRGDRQAAEALAAKIQTDTSTDLDPWWMYWLGQYRLHPAAMARLREMSQ